ncbi:hypothetical protein HIM_01058 [Hirsutella minnesotensis 3608]|nr:hypothetical protein HIM_01058 [Hirsutella minnesotensis 3608]
MKDGSTGLLGTPETAGRVSAYAQAHSTPLPAHIVEHHAGVVATRADADMLSSHFQSQLHVLLARAVDAKRVLEIGVYAGYSAMVWSHAIGPDGRVTGLEYSQELADVAREAFATRGISNIDIIVGNAASTLPNLEVSTPYDLVFIDADKTGYGNYLDLLLRASRPGSDGRLLRQGALIVADNVLRRGHVADPLLAEGADESWLRQLEAVRDFNDKCAGEQRLETFMLPLWDGVSIMRLRD